MNRRNVRKNASPVVGALVVAFASMIAFLEPNVRGTLALNLPPNVMASTTRGIQEQFGWPTTYLYTDFEVGDPFAGLLTYWGGILLFERRSVLLIRPEYLLVNVALSLLFVMGATTATYQYLHRSGRKLTFGPTTLLAAVGVVATYLALGIDLEFVSRYILPTIRFASIVAFWFVAISSLMLVLGRVARWRST